MDGMPLTIDEIASFYKPITGDTSWSGDPTRRALFFSNNLQKLKALLDDLVEKKYLKYEHPKDEFEIKNKLGKLVKKRLPREDLPKGYNFVTGKLSFEINKILGPKDIAPTMVATDMERIAVVDGEGIRKLTNREGLRLFGFPEYFQLDLPAKQAFDLLGNTVPVPVVEKVATRLLRSLDDINAASQRTCPHVRLVPMNVDSRSKLEFSESKEFNCSRSLLSTSKLSVH